MTARSLLVLSLGLNVVLLAAGWRFGRPSSAVGPPEGAAGAAAAAAAPTVRTQLSRVEVTLTNEPQPFHWDQIRSPDLPRYVAALRAMGCPAETIRDIVRGELEEEFLARRRVLLDPWQRRYWDYAARGLGNAVKEFEASLEALHEQTVGRLEELVGPVPEKAERKVERRPDARLDYLSAEKQAQVTELNGRYDELERAVRREGGPMTDERRARLAALRAQRQEALHGLMTAAEWEEYRLRSSRHAGAGRGLPGFEASADEMRALTRTLEQFNAADEGLDRRAPDYEARRQQQEELKRQREESLRAALGEARYAEYQRAKDQGFQQLHRVGERYGLPREALVEADDIRRLAQESLQRVGRDKTLTSEQREAVNAAVRDETRATLGRLLGEQALRNYERHGGRWLQGKR
ncbi:MAG: hypothetical protein RJA22_1970 [Verrucomicrobiota bacterium]|jgi:Arc/MetJ family transcription regulator